MKKVCAWLLLLGACAPLAWADNGLETSDVLVPFAYENLTVTTTAGGFTSATYNPATGKAKRAFVTCDTGDTVRYTYNGTTPTSSLGHLLATGVTVTFAGDTAIDNAKFIVNRGSTASCRVTYER